MKNGVRITIRESDGDLREIFECKQIWNKSGMKAFFANIIREAILEGCSVKIEAIWI